MTNRRAEQFLGKTAPTAIKAIKDLEQKKIVLEMTGRGRNRVYLAREIMKILQAPLQV